MLTWPSPAPSAFSAGMDGGLIAPVPVAVPPLDPHAERASRPTAASTRGTRRMGVTPFSGGCGADGSGGDGDDVLAVPPEQHLGVAHPLDVGRRGARVLRDGHQPAAGLQVDDE